MKLIHPHGGYGLGNELFVWAKGYILSQETGARLLHPAWGNNPRHYRRYFRTFRYDYQLYRVLVKMAPRYSFTEEDYRRYGVNDFVQACGAFISERGLDHKQHYVVDITGFWGGLSGLEAARPFLISQLMNTAHTPRNLYEVEKRLDRNKLLVAVHVRRGDFFQSCDNIYSGVERTTIPLEWYHSLCRSLSAALGIENLQFIICSDGTQDEVRPLIADFHALFTSAMPNSDVSDLLICSNADIFVCSISSYSLWAAFLGSQRYVWYRPNLLENRGGLVNRFVRSLGIYDDNSPQPGSVSRGIALDAEEMPSSFVDSLQRTLSAKQSSVDLVRGGMIISEAKDPRHC